MAKKILIREVSKPFRWDILFILAVMLVGSALVVIYGQGVFDAMFT